MSHLRIGQTPAVASDLGDIDRTAQHDGEWIGDWLRPVQIPILSLEAWDSDNAETKE
jgi:hypothetical protein